MRILHFSDLHVTSDPLRLGVMDWFGKRSTGWLNAKVGRGHHFNQAAPITAALVAAILRTPPDLLVFSGDATVLGMKDEYERVGGLLAPLFHLPGIAVPGNHDHYTRKSVRSRWFETRFTTWQLGLRVDHQTYPFAVEQGGVWFVAVNSSRPNVTPWDSRGGVGRPQRERLERLLKTLPPGRRILITHYPACLADGLPENRWRRMRDADRLIGICRVHGITHWLHGHRHVTYHRPASAEIPFDVHCAGSTTQRGRWGFNEYDLTDGRFEKTRSVWNAERQEFEFQGQV
jgi:3',5'-cyclic AMP phosphodiesterase CpdA